MTLLDSIGAKAGGRKAIFLVLSLFAVVMGASSEAWAIDCVADFSDPDSADRSSRIPPERNSFFQNGRLCVDKCAGAVDRVMVSKVMVPNG